MLTRRAEGSSLSGASRVAVSVALLLATVTALSPLLFPQTSADQAPAATDCTKYGLRAADPRAHPERVVGPGYRAGSAASEAGPLGAMARTFTAEGRTGQYHVIDAGVDPSRPVGLVIHLHGDGAAEYHDPGGRTTCLAAVAASHNDLLVVPRTPDTTGVPTWWEDLGGQRKWLTALVTERLLPELPVDRERITWTGYSGGAEMLSYGILAGPRELVTAGAAMVGGGGAPGALDTPATAKQRENLRMWWITGRRDTGKDPEASFDAVRAAEAGAEFYDDAGFQQVRLDLLAGRTHFDMPDARILDDLLSSNGVPRR